ncbi:MAG TPA: TlpA disulfide reductase family protein [Gemmatimonadaceae bacterium]|jgi:peroxiredoxin|nr:TlpA disulfide reductase family protein [Gemmatimonadaceae bacterium]
MTVRQQWGVVLGVIAVLALGIWALTATLGDELFPVEVGSHAPEFAAQTITASADTRHFRDYKGDVVIVNVWATWCEPCKVEMPSLEALYRQFAPHGLKVVAISVDETAGADSIRAYARNMGLTFDILHNGSGQIEKAFQTTGYPETFVIGRDGVIRKKWIGAADWTSPDNVALVRDLLGISAPGAD